MVHTTKVNELLDSMTPEEFDEWDAYDRIEPIGPVDGHRVQAEFASAVCRILGADLDPVHFTPWLDVIELTEQLVSPDMAVAALKGIVGGSTG